METHIKVSGKLVIEKIDRETKSVKEKREIDNVLTLYGSIHLVNIAYYLDLSDCGASPSNCKVDKLFLLDANQQLIKEIPGGSQTASVSGSTHTITITWTDQSSDAYTVYYAALGRSQTTYNNAVSPNSQAVHAVAVSPAFTKNSTDTVRYTWNINIQFGSV